MGLGEAQGPQTRSSRRDPVRLPIPARGGHDRGCCSSSGEDSRVKGQGCRTGSGAGEGGPGVAAVRSPAGVMGESCWLPGRRGVSRAGGAGMGCRTVLGGRAEPPISASQGQEEKPSWLSPAATPVSHRLPAQRCLKAYSQPAALGLGHPVGGWLCLVPPTTLAGTASTGPAIHSTSVQAAACPTARPCTAHAQPIPSSPFSPPLLPPPAPGREPPPSRRRKGIVLRGIPNLPQSQALRGQAADKQGQVGMHSCTATLPHRHTESR